MRLSGSARVEPVSRTGEGATGTGTARTGAMNWTVRVGICVLDIFFKVPNFEFCDFFFIQMNIS